MLPDSVALRDLSLWVTSLNVTLDAYHTTNYSYCLKHLECKRDVLIHGGHSQIQRLERFKLSPKFCNCVSIRLQTPLPGWCTDTLNWNFLSQTLHFKCLLQHFLHNTWFIFLELMSIKLLLKLICLNQRLLLNDMWTWLITEGQMYRRSSPLSSSTHSFSLRRRWHTWKKNKFHQGAEVGIELRSSWLSVTRTLKFQFYIGNWIICCLITFWFNPPFIPKGIL